MPRNSSGGVGGMFDDLKSRLGLGRGEDNYNDGYDDFDDDFSDDYDEEYDDEYAGYGSDYNESAPVGGFRAASVGSSSRRSRSSRDLSSNLVSIDDVKTSTRTADRFSRDSYDEPEFTSSYSSRTGTRNVVGNSGPAPSSPAYNARQREEGSRSEGVDSLFQPTTTSGMDAFPSYSAPASSSVPGTRQMTVIKPVVYGDVERVARSVKMGDVVVLAMLNTPEDLSNRILDFSFGVASALDANVECAGAKVFAIAKGEGLSESEKVNLRSQGVL